MQVFVLAIGVQVSAIQCKQQSQKVEMPVVGEVSQADAKCTMIS